MFQVRFGVVSVCGNVSRHTDTKPSTVESQTTIPVYQVYSLTASPQKLSKHRASFTHTSHSSWYRFTHVKGGNTHGLNVESRRQTYGPHPHTQQHIKVSTLYTTHTSTSTSQNKLSQLRLSFKSSFHVVSICGHVSRHTDKWPCTIESQTTVI